MSLFRLSFTVVVASVAFLIYSFFFFVVVCLADDASVYSFVWCLLDRVTVMLDTPGAFIGEFDALDGPKVTYAFEYFDYDRAAKSSSAVRQLLCYVEGKALLGKSVASGLLHRECKKYLNSVAAHVLISNESREERMLYQDSGCPCVGSFLFSIPDIVARGEKRRFCLIFLHPSYHELVARWDSLSSFVEVLLKRWTQRAIARYQNEYDTLKNLEQLREESRRKPLRTLTQLLTDSCIHAAGTDTASLVTSAVFEDLHCCFETILPQVFSQPIPLRSSEKDAARREAEAFLEEHLLLAQSSVDRVDVDLAHLPLDDVVLPRFAKQVVLVDAEIIVKPLPVWLLEYLSDAATAEGASSESQLAVHRLLRALFSGNQILITGDDARDCASLGMALSYMVPPSLVKMHLGSDRYRMPYESRVLSFSQRALVEHVFAEDPAACGGRDESHTVRLFDMEADGIVHVRLADGRIHAIQDCDALRRAVAVAAAAQNGRGERGEFKTAFSPPTTLENRIMTLLKPHLVSTAGKCAISVVSLQLVTTQFHQLVSEYVVRGRVYSQLFAKQEVETNSLSLSPVPPTATVLEAERSFASTSTERSPLPSQQAFSSRNLSCKDARREEALSSSPQSGARAGGLGFLGIGSSGSTEAPSAAHGADGARITKHAHLAPIYGKQFQHSHFVFSSFAPEDHAILVFLGSA